MKPSDRAYLDYARRRRRALRRRLRWQLVAVCLALAAVMLLVLGA